MENLELIVGAKNIGAAIGLPNRRVYQLAEAGQLPVIKIGQSIAIRRSKLAEWFQALEAQAAEPRTAAGARA